MNSREIRERLSEYFTIPPLTSPVCTKCNRLMVFKRNGHTVTFKRKVGDNSPSWTWRGDRWQCPKCNFSIVQNFDSGEKTKDDDMPFENISVVERIGK